MCSEIIVIGLTLLKKSYAYEHIVYSHAVIDMGHACLPGISKSINQLSSLATITWTFVSTYLVCVARCPLQLFFSHGQQQSYMNNRVDMAFLKMKRPDETVFSFFFFFFCGANYRTPEWVLGRAKVRPKVGRGTRGQPSIVCMISRTVKLWLSRNITLSQKRSL